MQMTRRQHNRREAALNRAADRAEEKALFSSRPQPRTKRGKIAKAIAEMEAQRDSCRAKAEAGVTFSGGPMHPDMIAQQHAWADAAQAEIDRLMNL